VLPAGLFVVCKDNGQRGQWAAILLPQALPDVSPPSDPSDTCRWRRRSNPYLVGHVIQTRA
jgi:hypothetical protein